MALVVSRKVDGQWERACYAGVLHDLREEPRAVEGRVAHWVAIESRLGVPKGSRLEPVPSPNDGEERPQQWVWICPEHADEASFMSVDAQLGRLGEVVI